MITVGGLICVIGIYLLVLQVDKGGPSIIIGLLLLIIGFFVSYTMIKEFIADCKKTKNNSKKFYIKSSCSPSIAFND